MRPTPYDTGKVKIGCRYDPPLINQYNPDQDWVQKALLGIETSWTGRECVIRAEREWIRNGSDTEHNQAVSKVIESIKQHFGVEE
jgi:hypothetical protein